MALNPRQNEQLHARLPIGKDEEILGVFRHHWFVYVSVWVIGLLCILTIMIVAVLLTTPTGDDSSVAPSYQPLVLGGALLLSIIIGLATAVPAWLKSQEQLVVTDEALLQILQPSIFGSKVSQLSLEHVNDVSVHKDFFGTLLGFGSISIETPGEQNNYIFTAVQTPDVASKTIIEAHENFSAALQSGLVPTAYAKAVQPKTVQVDANEYQDFLRYQQQNQAPGDGEQGADAIAQERQK